MFLRGDYKTPIEDMQQTRQCRIYHLFLGVLKHRVPFSRGPIFLPKKRWIFAYVVQF
jgi:hypothetical protein